MTDAEIARWRREQRTALLARRDAMPVEERRGVALRVAERLTDLVTPRGYTSIGLFWPIKHEINLLSWADALSKRTGLVLCLPVVVTRKEPLEYWRWATGEPLARGFWDIPVPARRDVLLPDLMLAPLVGFDRENYRLGYGGGYFDRTLASLPRRPDVIGVGYDHDELETIFPRSYDIPMDAVVTEQRTTLSSNRKKHAD